MVRKGGHVGSMAFTDRLSVSMLDLVGAAKKGEEDGPMTGVGLHEFHNMAVLKKRLD